MRRPSWRKPAPRPAACCALSVFPAEIVEAGCSFLIRFDDDFAYPIRTSAPLLAGRRRPAPAARPDRARQSWRAGRTGLAGLSVLHRHTVVAERGTHHRFSTWHAICRAGAAVAPRAPDHGIAGLLEAADPRNGGRLASAGGRGPIA